MRTLHKLKALTLGRLPAGHHADGGGLYLAVSPSGARSWVFRSRRAGRAFETGLGSINAVSLERARQKASDLRADLADGRNPLDEKRAAAAAARVEKAKLTTFKDASEVYIRSHRKEWSSPKSEISWRHTLNDFAFPIIGRLPVAAIDTGLVMKVLEQPIGDDETPLWEARPETANRLRGRIEAILGDAKVRGLRDGNNPARWDDHLEHSLLSRQKVAKTVHHAMLPFEQLPAFMVALQARDGIAARAHEFLILTCTRTSETLGAKWEEFNLEQRTWTIPAERMKEDREHRVPLCDRASEILHEMKREGDRPFDVTEAALRKVRKAAGCLGVTTHGFRATFSTWAAEHGVDRDRREMALSHKVDDKTEAAYQRSDMFALRRELADRWARYCAGTDGGNVVPLRRETA